MNATPIQSIWEEFAQSGAADLRERLVLQYASLVRYVIGRLAPVRPAVLDDDDILSEGVLGLIEAVDRYDPA